MESSTLQFKSDLLLSTSVTNSSRSMLKNESSGNEISGMPETTGASLTGNIRITVVSLLVELSVSLTLNTTVNVPLLSGKPERVTSFDSLSISITSDELEFELENMLTSPFSSTSSVNNFSLHLAKFLLGNIIDSDISFVPNDSSLTVTASPIIIAESVRLSNKSSGSLKNAPNGITMLLSSRKIASVSESVITGGSLIFSTLISHAWKLLSPRSSYADSVTLLTPTSDSEGIHDKNPNLLICILSGLSTKA